MSKIRKRDLKNQEPKLEDYPGLSEWVVQNESHQITDDMFINFLRHIFGTLESEEMCFLRGTFIFENYGNVLFNLITFNKLIIDSDTYYCKDPLGKFVKEKQKEMEKYHAKIAEIQKIHEANEHKRALVEKKEAERKEKNQGKFGLMLKTITGKRDTPPSKRIENIAIQKTPKMPAKPEEYTIKTYYETPDIHIIGTGTHKKHYSRHPKDGAISIKPRQCMPNPAISKINTKFERVFTSKILSVCGHCNPSPSNKDPKGVALYYPFVANVNNYPSSSKFPKDSNIEFLFFKLEGSSVSKEAGAHTLNLGARLVGKKAHKDAAGPKYEARREDDVCGYAEKFSEKDLAFYRKYCPDDVPILEWYNESIRTGCEFFVSKGLVTHFLKTGLFHKYNCPSSPKSKSKSKSKSRSRSKSSDSSKSKGGQKTLRVSDYVAYWNNFKTRKIRK